MNVVIDRHEKKMICKRCGGKLWKFAVSPVGVEYFYRCGCMNPLSVSDSPFIPDDLKYKHIENKFCNK